MADCDSGLTLLKQLHHLKSWQAETSAPHFNNGLFPLSSQEHLIKVVRKALENASPGNIKQDISSTASNHFTIYGFLTEG